MLASEVVSNFGSMLTRLVIPWIATLQLGAGPLAMGLLLVADLAAGVAATLLLGALVDRQSRRRVMIVADLGRAAIVAALALAAWAGAVSMTMLVLAAAANGLLTMAFELARSAWIAQNVAGNQLARRNAQLSAAGSLTEAASFGVGGWIYQALGSAISLVADAVSYLVSASLLLGVREKAAVPGPGHESSAGGHSRALWREARDGISTLWTQPSLRALAQIEVLVALGAGVTGTSYMIYVVRELGLETGLLGMVFALGGIGAAAGAAIAPTLGRRRGRGAAIALGLLALAIGAALIPLAADASWLALALLVGHQIVGDGGHVIYDVHDRTLRQTLAPGDRLARVDAGIRTLGQSASLAGALGGGLLASAIGVRGALLLAALLFAGAAVVAAVRLRRGAGAQTA